MRTGSKRNKLAEVYLKLLVVYSVRISSKRSPYLFTLLSFKELLCYFI